MVRKSFQNFKKIIDISVSVLNNNLKWAEQLSCDKSSLLCTSEMLQRNLDCSRLIRSVNRWDRVISQWGSSEEKLSTVKLKDSVNVALDLLVVPRDDWAEREIGEASLG